MNRSFTTNFLKNIASASLGTWSSIAFHFFSIIIITRHLSKDAFGLYSLVLVVSNFFGILAGLGLDLTLVHFNSSNNDAEREWRAFPTILLTRTISLGLTTVIFLCVGPFILPFLEARIHHYILYIAAIFFLSSFRDLFYRLFQALHEFKRYAAIQVLSAALKFSLILYLSYSGRLDLLNLLQIEIMTIAGVLIFQFFPCVLKQIRKAQINANSLKELKQLMRFSIPLYLNDLLTISYDRIDVFMIAAYLGPESIAYYEVAGKIPSAFTRMFQSFVLVYFPSLSGLLKSGDKDDGQKMMNQSLILLSVVILFLALLVFLFRRQIISLVFSEKYLASSLAFSLLMLNFYLRAISNIMGYSLVSAGHSAIPVKVNVISSIINILGNIIMIPAFGFIGAVYSMILTNTSSQCFYYYNLIKNGFLPDLTQYLKPLVALSFAIALHETIGHDIAPMAVLCLALYLVICWMLVKEFRDISKATFNLVRYRISPTKSM